MDVGGLNVHEARALRYHHHRVGRETVERDPDGDWN
jgi:hypothetical protein